MPPLKQEETGVHGVVSTAVVGDWVVAAAAWVAAEVVWANTDVCSFANTTVAKGTASVPLAAHLPQRFGQRNSTDGGSLN